MKLNNRAGKIKLSKAVEKYLIHIRALNFASNTIYCYSKDLDYLLENFGNIYLKDFTEEALDIFLIKIQNSKNNCLPRSRSTVNRIKIVYRSFFKWCFKSGYLKKDFICSLQLAPCNVKPTIPIEWEETINLLNTITNSNDPLADRDKTLFSVYAYTGIRKSEAVTLRICDYDKDGKFLYLTKSKGCTKRMQPIPSNLIIILNEYLGEKIYRKTWNKSLPLFSGVTSNIFLSSRQVSNRFEKWKRISGIRKSLTIHSFRAAYATRLYKFSKDPLLVSYAMGHHNFSTTKKYIAVDLSNINAVLERTFTI